MRRYTKLDSVAFLKDFRKWDKEIKSLEEKKAQIIGMTTAQAERLTGKGSHADTTANYVVKREAVQNEIDQIKSYKMICEKFLKTLTKDENEVVRAFFFRNDIVIGAWVDCYAHEHYTNPRSVYRMRADIISRCEQFMYDNMIS